MEDVSESSGAQVAGHGAAEFAVFEGALDGIAVLDPVRGPDGTIEDFVIVYANASAIDLSGRHMRDLVGRRWTVEYPRVDTVAIYREVVETGRPYQHPYAEYVATSGTRAASYQMQVTKFRDSAIVAFRDVTDERARALQSLHNDEAARVLQEVFLDVELPTAPGLELAVRYLPASGAALGGDWYDAFPVEGGICFVVGDVAGHGIGSAASMAQLRHAIRAFSDDPDPARMMVRLNRMLLRLAPGELASVVIAILDPDSRILRFASAGHPPVLRSRPEVTDFLPNPDGIVLGASPEASYGVHTKELRHGTTLLFFTDGLIESRESSLDVGMDELVEVATAVHGEGPDALCDAVLLWRSGIQREDDVCLLAVRLA